MTEGHRLYSYRTDPAVPEWDDTFGLIIFDGECVLCSAFARFVFRIDANAYFRFAMAQSPLGQALYCHYGLDPVEFETNLVIVDGRLHEKLAAFVTVMSAAGWPYRIAKVLNVLPRRMGDWLYDRVAQNRYRLFGRYDTCMMPSPELQVRIIG